ncbi:fructose-6-phosphate aldolase, partial [Candidatus Woesearchaeota archaeon]|nr:fructose-6-phosphate aldolase [Candidatus Woesearchaeota archaeon]
MKLFIDTANVEEIRKVSALGILDGVTTNPTLLAKEGRNPNDVAREILALVPGPVSLEVTALDAEGMVSQGKELATLASNVVVKIPMGAEGLRATKRLSDADIAVNMTLVFSANQALLAAKAGARYVSPFVGRIDDVGQDGMQVVQEIADIFRNYDFKCEILAASIRHPQHVLQAARL